MIDGVMAMPVQGPEQVFMEPVAVAVIGNHLGVLVQRLRNARDMGQAGQDRPDNERQAQKCRHDPPCECLPCPRHESLPEALRHACGAVLFYPPLGDNVLLCQNRTCMQRTPP